MRFSNILQGSNVGALDTLVEDTEQAPILARMDEPEIALGIIRAGLWASYLFNQQIIPLYTAHVFQSLTQLPPVDDELGPLLAGVMGAVRGELFTNNIYGNAKACHSHYQDIVDAYLAAGGSLESVDKIVAETKTAPGKKGQYITHLLNLLEDPLATFILIPAIEKSTPSFFETVAKHLNKAKRFDKYRLFVEKHVEFDRGEHSSVTMDWLEYIIRKMQPSPEKVTKAVSQVLTVLNLNRGRPS